MLKADGFLWSDGRREMAIDGDAPRWALSAVLSFPSKRWERELGCQAQPLGRPSCVTNTCQIEEIAPEAQEREIFFIANRSILSLSIDCVHCFHIRWSSG